METTSEKTKIEELTQMLANAQKTYAGCGGHWKAEMNKRKVVEFKKQLSDLGAEIPSNEDLYKIGVFNGKGSY